MKNVNLALELLHKLLRKDPELNESEIALLKKKNIELTTLREAEYNSDEFRNELSRIRDILLNESLQINKTSMKDFYAHGFTYSISETALSLPKSIEELYIKVDNWANRRILILDKEKKIAYMQSTSNHETDYQGACGICVSRMKILARLHNKSDFISLLAYGGLYMKLRIPDNFKINSDSLSKLLRLRVTN